MSLHPLKLPAFAGEGGKSVKFKYYYFKNLLFSGLLSSFSIDLSAVATSLLELLAFRFGFSLPAHIFTKIYAPFAFSISTFLPSCGLLTCAVELSYYLHLSHFSPVWPDRLLRRVFLSLPPGFVCMRYIKSMTQQKLSFLLAIYIGLFMNCAVFFRRFSGYAHEFTVWKGLSAVVELAGTVLVTFFLLRILSLFGRRAWRVLATFVVLCSAGASYYMTFLNVVIGYGIIASVMTTDIDLSKEVVGWHFIVWLVSVSIIPLVLIWSNRCRYTLMKQIRTPGMRWRSVAVVLLAGLMVWAPIRLLSMQQRSVERETGIDLPSYGGVVANSYLPSN